MTLVLKCVSCGTNYCVIKGMFYLQKYEGSINNVRLVGIAASVPKRLIDNLSFAEQMGGKRNKRQIALTGIKYRHICAEGQAASDFATVAGEKLLSHLGWQRDEIKVLIFVTQQPDLSRPSTAMLIQRRLGIGIDCTCFDVNMGCSGFTVGLQIIASMLSVVGGKGLLLVGDGRYAGEDGMLSRSDLLFGDAGAAAAVEVQPGYNMLFNQKSDGNRVDMIMCRRNGNSQMDGNGVLMMALNEVSDNIKLFRMENKLAETDIDYYVFHQGQKIILQGIASECGIAWEKTLNSYENYGNTSSASIPLSICVNEQLLKEQKQVRLLMSGFGIGLSWGCVYLNMNTENILPVIETDYVAPDKKEFNL